MIKNADSGDTIVLNGKFYAEDESSLISINKKVNIITTSGAVLDGKKKSGIFYLKNKTKGPTISGLTFINGNYVGGSAVIVNSKNIVFDKCIFENNTGTNNGGGAFATEWDQHAAEGLTIKNCIFRGNKAPASSGAVACFSTNFKIINTIFENNYASNTVGRTAYEGALQAGMTNTYGLISNCTFRNNYAKSDKPSEPSRGGALGLRKGTVVEKCIFINNNADHGGAVICSTGGELRNCIFIENYAPTGGAVYIESTQCSIKNCLFKNNCATTDGGAIYNKGTTTIETSNFTENNAKNNGGAIISLSNNEIKNCNFIENYATSGGAVYIESSKSTITDSSFKSNHATTDGGAIYNKATTIIKTSNLTQNYAKNKGGAIYNSSNLNTNN